MPQADNGILDINKHPPQLDPSDLATIASLLPAPIITIIADLSGWI